MPKHCWKFARSALIFLWIGAVQLAVASSARYTVDKIWRAEDGLPHEVIISLLQGRDGYLWLGTLGGLARFDGFGRFSPAGRIEFPVYDEGNTPGLNSKVIVKLFEDSKTNLWIGTDAGVVLVDRNGKVRNLDFGRGGGAERLAACEDKTGAVWLYSYDGQLARYKTNRVDVWKVGPERSDFRGLLVDEAGLLWVGMDWQLLTLDPERVTSEAELPYVQGVLVGKLDFIVPSKKGGFWRFANGMIQRWKGRHVEEDLGPYPWSTNIAVITACEDIEGTLFVGTYGNGVYYFAAEGKAAQLEGLSHNYILSLLIDREGSLWIGTNGRGLNRAKRQVFGVLSGSESSTVQSVSEDRQGGLWIGYNGERLDHWAEGRLQRFTDLWPAGFSLRRPVEINLRSVFVGRDEEVWAGISSGFGPHLFRVRDGRFEPIPHGEAFSQDVAAIFQDHQGVLWVGTGGGLARWDGASWQFITISNQLSADNVKAIADDAEGNLWIGTRGNGLKRLRNGEVSVFTKNDGLPSHDISSLYMDAEGVLWIGTSVGLVRFQGGKFTDYSAGNRLIRNNIGYLLEDADGYLWMGSNAGLIRARKQDLNNFAPGPTNVVSCRAYGKADGLPTSQCTFGSQPGACRGRDGKLWFPTIEGLASVNPSELIRNTNPPPVVIESVMVEGRLRTSNTLRAGLPDSIVLKPGEERLEIDYTSLNLSSPERARFRYRMHGHDTAWIEAGNVRTAHYSKLPPKEYRFQVTACNEDEVWNERGSSLSIIVLPPFWRTSWFLALVTAALLGIVVGTVHFVSTQKLQRQLEGMRQQEALEKERARISRDLHDQLGANLTQVALLGELAETDKNEPAEVEAHARQISQTARETTRALDEIVWTVNPSNDTLDGLINYLCKYAQEYLALADLRYRLEVPAQLPNAPISPEVRHNTFLAAKEAVNNLVKHAQASSAWLRLKLEPGRFTLEIEDNGKGLGEKDAKTTRSGLRNMRKRMEDIGGEFELKAGAEGGTLVRLTAPLG